MFDSVDEINWLAVLAGTAFYYVLGAVWFTPLFGRAWDRSIGVTRQQGQRYPPLYYVMPLISALVVTTATAALASMLALDAVGDGALLGLLVGCGYAAPVSLTNAVTPHTPRPLLLGAVTASYHVTGIAAAAAIVVALS